MGAGARYLEQWDISWWATTVKASEIVRGFNLKPAIFYAGACAGAAAPPLHLFAIQNLIMQIRI